ncbi:MAG: LysM peptidoglycan-binding domain-containing protein [Sporocytophaga sp.]|uniref:LysM peptidoglycan-binding domain-containing protein n=1 Tax=Sporocytophaga sp. TaxID=2231183 RepID=UPI001AFE9501|nr:LysM peptidoglycan-binding domain-containing protein [Sporocytophaga sp.]MBO9699375.1 LysM peptidoglycan-binding domain-containing protein [Sporocytophaga sp.]
MIKKGLFVWLIFIHQLVLGQIPEVPEKIYFADMELRLTDKARKTIQSEVDGICRTPKYLQIKVDRADLYFPLVEKVFKEEGFPDDFKYLAIQESSLLPDAVSSSNAVGYWQFKKETAIEVGLRVDRDIDERMNIISASRGAATYIKRHNATLDNWVYALVAYNTGLGGVKSHIDKKYIGSRKMEIDSDIHWYFRTFLAHKIAYQDKVGKNIKPSFKFVEYTNCHRKSLEEIADETSIAKEDVLNHNKWVLCKRIPDDKPYVVVLLSKADQEALIASQNEKKSDDAERRGGWRIFRRKQEEVVPNIPVGEIAILSEINGLKVIKAKEGDSFAKLAFQGGITTHQLLDYNDLNTFDKVKGGKIYYLEPKRSRAIVMFHTVKPGETLQDVSDQYGIRVNDIKRKNRMKLSENGLKPGRVLWLKKRRPKDTAIEIKPVVIEKAPETIKPTVDNTGINKDVRTEEKPEVKVVDAKPEVKPEIKNQVPEPKEESIFTESYIKTTDLDTEKNYQIHIVEPGQTLYGISKMYSTTVDSLKYFNYLEGGLKPGYQLKIREINTGRKTGNTEIKGSGNFFIHKVEKGETLYSISRKYSVSVREIQEWNSKTNNAVSIGEELKILKVK